MQGKPGFQQAGRGGRPQRRLPSARKQSLRRREAADCSICWSSLDSQENFGHDDQTASLCRRYSCCLSFCIHPQLAAQQPRPSLPAEDYVRAHYTKYEYRIPMRDGKRLFTAVYVPKDGFAGSGPVSVSDGSHSLQCCALRRGPVSAAARPFGRVREERLHLCLPGCARTLDERGRLSGDAAAHRRKKSPQDVDDASDTYDTIEFLLKHVANNNGKVGIWGISYPGFYTSASIIDSHPALVAASPQAPMTDLFLGDDGYHGGAFMLAANFGFYAFFHPQKNPTEPSPTVPFRLRHARQLQVLSGRGQHRQSGHACI